ncbi:hypothetical protein ACFVIM_02245 [Streptomyces sp. NPDC057638]
MAFQEFDLFPDPLLSGVAGLAQHGRGRAAAELGVAFLDQFLGADDVL